MCCALGAEESLVRASVKVAARATGSSIPYRLLEVMFLYQYNLKQWVGHSDYVSDTSGTAELIGHPKCSILRYCTYNTSYRGRLSPGDSAFIRFVNYKSIF